MRCDWGAKFGEEEKVNQDLGRKRRERDLCENKLGQNGRRSIERAEN